MRKAAGQRDDKSLILRFCPPEEINKKRQNGVIEQSKFLAKVKALKSGG